MTLGEKIQQLRKNQKLSQEQLAVHINVSRQAISKWELGEAIPDTEHMIELSRFFKVSLDYLLLDDDAPYTDVAEKSEVKTNVRMISTGLLIIGLLISFVCWVTFQSWLLTMIGLIIQIVGFSYFIIRGHQLNDQEQQLMYAISAWLMLPFPIKYFGDSLMTFYPRPRLAIFDFGLVIILYLMVGIVITRSMKSTKKH